MTYFMQVYGVYHCWFNQHFDLCMILMGSARVWWCPVAPTPPHPWGAVPWGFPPWCSKVCFSCASFISKRDMSYTIRPLCSSVYVIGLFCLLPPYLQVDLWPIAYYTPSYIWDIPGYILWVVNHLLCGMHPRPREVWKTFLVFFRCGFLMPNKSWVAG